MPYLIFIFYVQWGETATPDVSKLFSKAIIWQVSLEDCANCGRVCSRYILPILYFDASTSKDLELSNTL